MTNTDEAELIFKRREQTAADGLNEYLREQAARFANYERLKAERLARASIKPNQQ
jgi:hypothetical protein